MSFCRMTTVCSIGLSGSVRLAVILLAKFTTAVFYRKLCCFLIALLANCATLD